MFKNHNHHFPLYLCMLINCHITVRLWVRLSIFTVKQHSILQLPWSFWFYVPYIDSYITNIGIKWHLHAVRWCSKFIRACWHRICSQLYNDSNCILLEKLMTWFYFFSLLYPVIWYLTLRQRVISLWHFEGTEKGKRCLLVLWNH